MDPIGSQPISPQVADLLGRGNRYLNRGELQRAREVFREARTLAPSEPAVHNLIAETYYAEGSYGKALRSVKRSCNLDPLDPKVWVFRGDIHMARGRFKRASKAYGKALADAPNLEALISRADSRMRRGHLDDACDDLAKALSMAPGNTRALDVRRGLRRAGVAEAKLRRTPAELAWDRLEAQYWDARTSTYRGDKAEYLETFNRDFAPKLIHEGAALERLAKYHAYLVMERGQRINFNILSHLRPHASHPTPTTAPNCAYAKQYLVADSEIIPGSAMQAYLLMPVDDDDPNKQAIIVFRGTSPKRWQDGVARDMGLRAGLSADADLNGVGYEEFHAALPALRAMIERALRTQNGVTFLGHSLGAAFGKRAYIDACRRHPERRRYFRSVSFNGPALDRYTASRHRQQPHQVFDFVSSHDVVHRGGEVHLDASVYRYCRKGKTLSELLGSHNAAELSDLLLQDRGEIQGSILGSEVDLRLEPDHRNDPKRHWETLRRLVGVVNLVARQSR